MVSPSTVRTTAPSLSPLARGWGEGAEGEGDGAGSEDSDGETRATREISARSRRAARARIVYHPRYTTRSFPQQELTETPVLSPALLMAKVPADATEV
jgi:hypothetical protein